MRNLIFAALFSVACVPVLAGECSSGSCGSSLRAVTSTVVGIGRNVVRLPVNIVRNVRKNVAVRQSARQSRRVSRRCGC
jgi:cell shape-determining protein MreC